MSYVLNLNHAYLMLHWMILQFSMQSGQTDRNQPDKNYNWEWKEDPCNRKILEAKPNYNNP